MLLSLYTTVGPVHEKLPLHKGWHKACDTKTGAQCGAYGLWQKHNFSKQQVSQPTADCKVIRKVISFCKITAATVQCSQSSWQANSSSVLHHHKVHRRQSSSLLHHHKAHTTQCHVLKGSAQLILGDIGGDAEAQDQFSPKESNPEQVKNPFIPVPEVQTPKDRRCNGDRGTENDILHSELFVVPGAQNFIKMLKALNFTYSAWCTELCMSAWGTLGLQHHRDWCWISQVRSFIFAIFYFCAGPTHQIGVGIFLFFVF